MSDRSSPVRAGVNRDAAILRRDGQGLRWLPLHWRSGSRPAGQRDARSSSGAQACPRDGRASGTCQPGSRHRQVEGVGH